jgi:hypothetical protein
VRLEYTTKGGFPRDRIHRKNTGQVASFPAPNQNKEKSQKLSKKPLEKSFLICNTTFTENILIQDLYFE